VKKILTELSLEELKKKRRTLELITGILTGLFLVLLIVEFLEYYNTKVFDFEQLFPLLLAIFLILNFIRIKKIIAEIKSREADK
jgi:hypothetical protein